MIKIISRLIGKLIGKHKYFWKYQWVRKSIGGKWFWNRYIGVGGQHVWYNWETFETYYGGNTGITLKKENY